jgi:glutamine synthetase type III
VKYLPSLISSPHNPHFLIFSPQYITGLFGFKFASEQKFHANSQQDSWDLNLGQMKMPPAILSLFFGAIVA